MGRIWRNPRPGPEPHAPACPALSSADGATSNRARVRRGRCISSGCRVIAAPGVIRCASMRRRAKWSSPCRRAAASRRRRRSPSRHGGWIAARLGRLPEAVPFDHGTIVPLRNMPHRIVHRRGVRGTVWREIDARGNRLICVAGEAPHVARRVGDFLKREARRDLEAASRRYAEELGVQIKRIAVRDQSSRWGSCSTSGVAVLLLAPHSGAALRARLSRGARGGPSGRDEPLARGSGGCSSGCARTCSAPRRGSTRTAPICIATARRS